MRSGQNASKHTAINQKDQKGIVRHFHFRLVSPQRSLFGFGSTAASEGWRLSVAKPCPWSSACAKGPEVPCTLIAWD